MSSVLRWIMMVPLTGTALGCGSRPAEDGPLARGAPPPTAVLLTERYELHSDPWINLHHFLYQWARADRGIGSGRQSVLVPERDGALPEGAGDEAWSTALTFYREHVAELGHFDESMLVLKAGLLELTGAPDAVAPDVIPGISAVLSSAMPVYREHWWPEHDRANRAWMDRVAEDLRAYEGRWVSTVSRAFGGGWPEERLRVDVATYGNWAGGYTSNEPPHTVVLSRDAMNNRGLYGLEILFHESGHVSPLGEPLRRSTRAVFEEAGVDEPDNLRHAMLFAIAGDVVRGIAEERGDPTHVPYVIEEGLVDFAGWRDVWPPVRDVWLPGVRAGDAPKTVLRRVADELR